MMRLTAVLLAFGVGVCGCCMDGGYLYRVRGKVVESESGIPMSTSVRMSLILPSKAVGRAVVVPTDSDGSLVFEGYTGLMWGTCYPLFYRVPDAPRAQEIWVSVDGDSTGWRVIPGEAIQQKCNREGCLLDVGMLRVTSSVPGEHRP